jgi:LCP family protein required for cell wall assembly
MARRLLLGVALIVVGSAAISGALVSGEITALKKAINQNPSLAVKPGTLASAGSGAPQTLLLVGDDRRALTRYYHHAVASHSNEMLLIRFDPSKPWISMLSIPRELWVTIQPDHGPPVTNRINFAYTLGGSQLMTETIKRVLGLSVNHVVVIDFGHFKRAVDEMGCVYSTIDHRYYHSNVGSVEQYQEINLQPGYQKLCGTQALEYVSYRHGDTSLVRDARNQAFMLDVKKQFGPSLFANRAKFERIFGAAVQTDPSLHTTKGLLDLVTLLVGAAGRPVRQVHFQATLLPTYDAASPQQISDTVKQFLSGNPTVPRRRTNAVAHALRHRRARASLPLVPTPPAAAAAARTAAARLPFPLEYPGVRDQLAAADPDDVRIYSIRDEQGVVHRAYVVVISRGEIGQYYDVQGMGWTNAPMFAGPDQTVQVAGRTYDLYYEGSNLKMIAWREYGAIYWVRNTLTDDLPNSEMLAIAEESAPVTGTRPAAPATLRAGTSAVQLPARRPVKRSVGTLEWYGVVLAFLAWVGLAVLAGALIAGRRELRALREQLAVAVPLDARQRALAASHGISLGGYARALEPERRSRGHSRGRTAPAVAVAAAALGVALGVALLAAGSARRARTSAIAVPRTVLATPRSVPVSTPVAVLNATGRTGVAHDLAARLRAQGVTVSTIGDAASVPDAAGMLVLYAAGSQPQARALAQLLGSGSVRLALLDPATRSAAGGLARLVVVVR